MKVSPLKRLTLLASTPLALDSCQTSIPGKQSCTCSMCSSQSFAKHAQYDELWERYMQVEVSGSVTKQRLPELLEK